MKLERIHIERYGAWQDLDLPVDPEGISVYYGPNEAGKSTLMRFVRGMLYGFRKNDPGRPVNDPSAAWGGSLEIQHNAQAWVVRRAGRHGTRGLATAWRADDEAARPSDATALMDDVVDGVSESVFENIFAVGLYELQELATLEDHEVAQHIYSMSLGLDGQALLRLIETVRSARDEILNSKTGSGRLGELNRKVAELDAQIEQLSGTRRRYEQLREEYDQWEETIVELKQRQQGLENQLHGHEYMDRVYEPWNKVRKLQRELDRMPDLPDFPHDGLRSLESIETELATLRGHRNALLQEARELRHRAAQISPSPEFRRYRSLVQAFVDQRQWIADLISFAEENDQRIDTLDRQLDACLSELGPGWSAERLRRIDVTHVTGACMSQRRRDFRRLEERSRTFRRRYRRMQSRFHRRQERLQQLKKQLGGRTVEAAIIQTREELIGLEDISRLRVRESELAQRRVGVANQLHRIQLDPSLPRWVYATFSALGVAGLALGLIGIVNGLTANGMAGLCYAILGVFCTGMTWSLKDHFEQEVENSANRLRSELRELDLRLAETRSALERILPERHHAAHRAGRATGNGRSLPVARPAATTAAGHVSASRVSFSPSASPAVVAQAGSRPESVRHAISTDSTEPAADQATELRRMVAGWQSSPHLQPHQSTALTSPSSGHIVSGTAARAPMESSAEAASRRTVISSGHTEADMIRECIDRLRDLEAIIELEKQVESRRHQLVGMRQQMRDIQREFGIARQNWSSHLVEQGLDETIEVENAIQQRDLVARGAAIVQRMDELAEDSRLTRRMVERFRKRIEETGHRLQQWDADYSQPLDVLRHWEAELVRAAEQSRERRALKSEAKKKRAEASRLRGRLRRLAAQQEAILVRGGSVSRDEFERRAEMLSKRFELNERLEHARRELSAAAAGDRAMAIVESDLEAYDPRQNSKCVGTIRSELDDVTIDLEDAFENLGRFRRDIEALENDRSSAELRFEREQLLSSVTELAEEWFALDWSVHTLEELRIEFERNHQPPILARAKEYLNRLSGGRYRNIWTPMGQRTLCVDDTDGNTLMVEHLSGGAREQLFLAIRMALIEHFSNLGVELPVVLDDVLVNFDEQRTQAAVTELIRQTGEHQQILFFTCHQYLAEMFRQRGVSTVVLPDRRALSRERLAG